MLQVVISLQVDLQTHLLIFQKLKHRMPQSAGCADIPQLSVGKD